MTDAMQQGFFGEEARPGAYHCTFTKADGTACLAYATKGSQFCRAHDPDVADAVQAARVRGGKQAKALYANLKLPPAPPVASHADVLQGLQDLISRLRDRHLGVAEARALIQLYQSVTAMLPPPEDPRLAGVNWREEIRQAGVPEERIETIYTHMVNYVMSRADLGKPTVRVEYVNNWRSEVASTPLGADLRPEPGQALQLVGGGPALEEDDTLHGDRD
jgi:hypothetical protein